MEIYIFILEIICCGRGAAVDPPVGYVESYPYSIVGFMCGEWTCRFNRLL